MKAFKKLALVTAIAAAPFAQAELVTLEDSLLGEMTGQAGISIELDTLITIDSFTYTDTDGKGNGAGSLVMSGIAFGGATVAGAAGDDTLKDLVIDIDVDGTNGVVIQLHGTDTQNSLLGVNPVDFGLHVDSVTASGVTNAIASNINIAGALGPIDVTINNVSGGDLINVEAYFEVTSGSLNVDVIGLGISNLVIGQDENPLYEMNQYNAATGNYDGAVNKYRGEIDGVAVLATTGMTAAQVAATINGAPTATITAQAEAGIIAATNQAIYNGAEATFLGANPGDTVGAAAAGDAAVLADAGVSGAAQVTADGGATAAVYLAATNANNANNMAFVSIAIGSEDTVYSNLTQGTVEVSNALTVTLNSFNIDVSMDLAMGETDTVNGVLQVGADRTRSLGSIALDNLDMSGTTLKIYGH
jgi:hypothetical protein